MRRTDTGLHRRKASNGSIKDAEEGKYGNCNNAQGVESRRGWFVKTKNAEEMILINACRFEMDEPMLACNGTEGGDPDLRV
jgi:hypothetical protein